MVKEKQSKRSKRISNRNEVNEEVVFEQIWANIDLDGDRKVKSKKKRKNQFFLKK